MVLRVRIAIRVILEVGLGWCEKWEEGEDNKGNRVSHYEPSFPMVAKLPRSTRGGGEGGQIDFLK